MSVAEWLDGAGLGEYAAGFELHGYDELELLRDLTPEETEELALCVGMKRGHVLKFRRRCLGPAQGAVPQPVLTSPALVSPGGAAALLGSPSTPTLTPRPASASASASAAAAASFSASAGSPARASRARAAVRPRRLQKSIAAAAEEDLPPPSQRSSSSSHSSPAQHAIESALQEIEHELTTSDPTATALAADISDGPIDKAVSSSSGRSVRAALEHAVAILEEACGGGGRGGAAQAGTRPPRRRRANRKLLRALLERAEFFLCGAKKRLLRANLC
jgi:hypothetical protein